MGNMCSPTVLRIRASGTVWEKGRVPGAPGLLGARVWAQEMLVLCPSMTLSGQVATEKTQKPHGVEQAGG